MLRMVSCADVSVCVCVAVIYPPTSTILFIQLERSGGSRARAVSEVPTRASKVRRSIRSNCIRISAAWLRGDC